MNSLSRTRVLGHSTGIRLRELFCKTKMLAVAVALLATSPLCRAQIHATSLGSAIELARVDMTSQRNGIVSATMQLSDKDAAAFWPIYRKYEYERSVADDGRAAVVKEYAEKYSTITDNDAKSMTERMMEYDSREIALKKKYAKEFSRVLPATTVAKFFQLDHRIDLLMGMQIESSLPPLWRPQNAQQQKPEPQGTESQNVGQQN